LHGHDGGGDGGGIYNTGTLTVNSCTISGNFAVQDQYSGGGRGGGIFNSGTLTLNNSTVAGNSAFRGGGIYNLGTVTLNNDTISGNSGAEGNIDNYGTATARNTIIAGNSGTDFRGDLTSQGHNLIGTIQGPSPFVPGPGDLLGVDPQLGPLQDNGGPTQTMALLPGSPAIDRGDNSGAPDFDQRGPGFSRSQDDGLLDIGAFEFQDAHPVVNNTTLSASASSSVAGQSITFTASVAALLEGASYPTATGAITFTVDGGTPNSVALDVAGQASWTMALTRAGTHSIVATYSGAARSPAVPRRRSR
jgi:hypothetical protein